MKYAMIGALGFALGFYVGRRLLVGGGQGAASSSGEADAAGTPAESSLFQRIGAAFTETLGAQSAIASGCGCGGGS